LGHFLGLTIFTAAIGVGERRGHPEEISGKIRKPKTWYPGHITTNVYNPLTKPFLFLNGTDVISSSAACRVVVEIDLSAYHDMIPVIRSDLMNIEKQKQQFTPVSVLKQFELL
jgi:hypothetical protein